MDTPLFHFLFLFGFRICNHWMSGYQIFSLMHFGWKVWTSVSDRHRFMQSADLAHMVGINSYFKVVREISKAWGDLIRFNKLFKLGFIHRMTACISPRCCFWELTQTFYHPVFFHNSARSWLFADRKVNNSNITGPFSHQVAHWSSLASQAICCCSAISIDLTTDVIAETCSTDLWLRNFSQGEPALCAAHGCSAGCSPPLP